MLRLLRLFLLVGVAVLASYDPRSKDGDRYGESNEKPRHTADNSAVTAPTGRSESDPRIKQRKRFWSGYEPIEKFTLFLAVFTLLLVVVGGLQVFFFAESERAELIVKDVQFRTGEPSVQPGGLDLIIILTNVGKHTAWIKDARIVAGIFTHKKELAAVPDYSKSGLKLSGIPPIPPTETGTVSLAGNEGRLTTPISKLVRGFESGAIPIRFYGWIEYDTGYSWLRYGRTGFCFEFVPIAQRQLATFKTCNNAAYTYGR